MCHSFFMSCHSCIIYGIILMHTSHSCIIVTEMPESEPVEPEPGVEFLVEPEENQGKQLCMIPYAYLKFMQFSYVTWVLLG